MPIAGHAKHAIGGLIKGLGYEIVSHKNRTAGDKCNIVKYIPEIFKYELNEEVKDIIDVNKGLDCIVKEIKTKNNQYTIKFPKYKKYESINREYIGLKTLSGKVPVPKVISRSAIYIIEEYIHGVDLDDINLTNVEKMVIYRELGSILKRINSVKMSGFGFIDNRKVGAYKTLHDCIMNGIKKNILKLKKLIDNKNYNKILKYLEHFDK